MVPSLVEGDSVSYLSVRKYGIVFQMDEDIFTTFVRCYKAESSVLAIDLEGALESDLFTETLPIHHFGSVCLLFAQLLLESMFAPAQSGGDGMHDGRKGAENVRRLGPKWLRTCAHRAEQVTYVHTDDEYYLLTPFTLQSQISYTERLYELQGVGSG